jgi:hypothetical protein
MGADTWGVGRGWDMGMKAPTETDLVRQCLDLLALKGLSAWRFNSGRVATERGGKRHVYRFNGAAGCADILGILTCHRHGDPTGIFLAVECKRGSNRPTPTQAAFLDAVRRAGGVALVVKDVRELEAELARLGY